MLIFSHLFSPHFSPDKGGGSGGDDDDKDTKGAKDDSGESDDDKDSTDEKDKKEGEGQKDDKPKMTHTKKEVDAAAGSARKGAESKLLKDLGVDSIDDAKVKLKKQDDAEAANNTELENAQKDLEKLTKVKGEQDGKIETLLSRVVSSSVKKEALDSKYGLKPEAVNDLWKLIKNDEKLVEMLEIDEDTFEVTGIEKAIKSAIKGRDYMLAEEEDPKKKPGSPPKNPRSRDNSKNKDDKPKRVFTL